MLDVHPPHHAASTWRDFFIHIATIVVGLLIAVGLEQTVEYFHHRHESSDLRDTLRGETSEILRDSRDTDIFVAAHREWLGHRIEQAKAAVWKHQPLGDPAPYKIPISDYPDDPLWRAAKAGGLGERLSPEERNAYSEVELLCGKVDTNYDAWRNAQNNRLSLEQEMPQTAAGVPDFSKASSDDLRTYLNLLVAEMSAANIFQIWNRNLLGAEQVISSGDLNLQKIFAAEKAAAAPNDPNAKP